MMEIGKTGAIRQQALDTASLAAMDKHGNREDASSLRRRVKDEEPLVYGSLDICEARNKHVEGCKEQSGNKTKALHMLVQFPPALIPNTEEGQKQMMAHAVKFANDFHGGDAVFAARLDRDEKGTHKVDVFLMPRYEFAYKDGRTQRRTAVSKFAKEAAQQRFGKQDRRAQGSALQDAFHEYLCDEMGLDAKPPKRKSATVADRVEPEVYALRRDKDTHSQQVAADRRKLTATRKQIRSEISDDAAAVQRREAAVKKAEAKLAEERQRLDKEAAVVAAAQRAAGKTPPAELNDIVERAKQARKAKLAER